ncbi:hypothetical protein F3Y22_tig00009009pilonHSYRG00024 [Hibiscus syriacus]|uniref:Uncharacterized protein n=1 Tax=Hibiscus syriacus TaxID=106335 RepID=A0A6A3CB70_HIBSY|nr:hypothetical protein F3Y22_tig00009009pilonHSYRG00024 [Hibiscus syriacus]
MAGLRAVVYDFDYDEYHSYVHGRLPYDNLKPDPQLRSLLMNLPLRKIIFTNADKVHAAKALSKLGFEDCFEGIICFETLNPTHKNTVYEDEDDIEFLGSAAASDDGPSRSSPKIFDMIDHMAHPKPDTTLPKTPVICKPQESAIERALEISNIEPQRTCPQHPGGKRVGLHTVLVGSSHRTKGADYALEIIHNIKQALPELWETEMKSEVNYLGQVAVETSATA